jgi:hypothetical protein
MTVVKARPEDSGVYVTSAWGQYATAHMIVNRAVEFGYSDAAVIALAGRKLALMGPSSAPELSAADEEALIEAGEAVEQWLNESVAPEGHSFGWYDGEFYLQPTEWWQD